MNEIWKTIRALPAYEVSSLGRVRRIIGGRGARVGHILSPGKLDGGHLFVIIQYEGKKLRKLVSHLVATEFIGDKPFDSACVLHWDDIPNNNTPSNLRWGTKKENSEDRKRNKGWHDLRGQENPACILTPQDVIEIREYTERGVCGSCLGKIYGVSKETIYAIRHGRTWTHLGDRQ